LRLDFEAQVGKRTSTDSNFAIHKEKEMNFRRWITALAVLALFAGFAIAQVANSGAGTGALQCAASVAVPPTLRSEGLTELVGDIVLTCTGGPTPVIGAPIQTANFIVSFGTQVTSRLLTYNSLAPTLATTNTSEALLLIDEPGSGLATYNGTAGIGPNAPQTLCGASGQPYSLVGAGSGGCVQYVANVAGGDYTMSSSAGNVFTNPANVYSGVVGSNQVTFYGIPIMPPTSAGVARVFRMTNIRVNANALFGGGLAGTTQVLASISISGPTSVPVNNPVQIAGFVQSGLSTSVRNIGNSGTQSSTNLNQCSTASVVTPLNIVRFSENFGTAFKTRVGPTSSTNGQSASPIPGQNTPGQIYNSESGFIFPQITGVNNGSVAGLADYGTRLKAVFNNVPSTVRIFVSTTNVVNLTGLNGTQPPGASNVSYAQQIIGDMVIDGNGTAPTVPTTGYTNVSNTLTQLNGYSELSVVGNSATAVWEIINTNPATPENFDFGVWIAYTASPNTNTPPPGTATVNLSFAPVPPEGAFTAAAGAMASGTLTIPRFADTSTANSIFGIVPCTTTLLFPFVTNQGGFDTGIALMNTTADPFGTKPQSGTCAMNFYGQNAPPQYVTASIPSGMNTAATTYAFLASSIAPNFQGYMIAVCQFQLAHGYGFISDLGAQKLAEGYIALVVGTGTSARTANPEQLEN
jgi:hypothetical protein